jgi:hypothetical protein
MRVPPLGRKQVSPMKKEAYPILEFDDTRLAKIEPSLSYIKTEGYEYCVIVFFREVLDAMEMEGRIKVVKYLNCETLDIPIYEMEYMGIPGIFRCGRICRFSGRIDRPWIQ